MNFENEKAKDALAFDPPFLGPYIKAHKSAGIVIKTPYSEELSKLLRSIAGSSWNSTERAWVYPYKSADKIREYQEKINNLASSIDKKNEKERKLRWDAKQKEIEKREKARTEERSRRKEAERVQRVVEEKYFYPIPLRGEYLNAPSGAPLCTLILEAIGDDTTEAFRSAEKMISQVSGQKPEYIPPREGVFQIFGLSGKYWIKCRIYGRSDYSAANSKGSRGVKKIFHLQEAVIYLINEPVSWKKTDTYFLRIIGGERIKMSEEEVIKCLAK